MTLIDIALICWNNRRVASFGGQVAWPNDVFRAYWFRKNNASCWAQTSKASGWYWFEIEMKSQDIANLQKPTSLPQNACDFGSVSSKNIKLFGEEICQIKSHLHVVYNGHEKNVLSRIRSHFAVANDKTGALGIRYFPLSNKNWAVSVFHKGILETITSLTPNQKRKIASFCDSKTGRTAVEAAWRTTYGWPLLCKA